MRIAIGGFGHETNTLSPLVTDYRDFAFVRGEALLGQLGDCQRPPDVELVPTFSATAWPSGLIRKSAYRRIKQELLHELSVILPLDGVYLGLHGAMEVEEIGDGEGDLAAAVRALVGPDTLISVSLDLHGNISPALVDNTDVLTALRTAPHRDGAETRQRALSLLVRALQERLRPVPVLVKPPLLLAGEAAMTNVEPARSLYAELPRIAAKPGIMDASILVGCAWTDSAYSSTSVIVVAESDRALVQREAACLATELWARRRQFVFGMETASPDEAIARALASSERPVFLTDSGDNVTAGAAGDIPLLAERLIALGAEEALVAGLADPGAVRQCAAAGERAEVTLEIGGKIDTSYAPLRISGRVLRLVSAPDDPPGAPTMATVRIGGVTIILAVDRRPFTDRASIAAAGVDPMGQRIVVVKQGYLFPDLADSAPRGIMALTPGASDLRLERLPYRRVPRPIYPLDQDCDWQVP